MTKPEPCTLTAQQEKLWSDTRVALLWHCPAFSHIFYTMLDTVNSKYIALFTKDVPVAATDGSALLLNPETFFKYDLNERIFICAHEIMHCVFDHMGLMKRFQQQGKVSYSDGSTLPYVHEIMNMAMDYVINDALVNSKVGKAPKDCCHDTKVATEKDAALDAYKKLFKSCKGIVGKIGSNGQKGFDEHLAPGTTQGKDPGQAMQERNPVTWQTAVAAAAQAAKLQGKLPAGLERLLNEILEPKVDWRERIQALFARRVGGGTYNWRTADRRLIVRDIIAPGRSGFGADTVVIAGDTSGSIGEKELNMFFAEMRGILEEVRPKRILIAWCDAQLHRVDEAYDAADLDSVRYKGAPGGGGTSFVPVFEWMAQEGIEPEALVYLTDGYGTFPNAKPSYPVIWGSISPAGTVKYPFGDVVDVPVQA